MDQDKQPGIQIAQVFLSNAHFEHRPDALSIPVGTTVPESKVSVRLQLVTFDKDIEKAAAGVIVTVSTDPEDQEAFYRFSVEMMAIIEAEEGKENLPPTQYAAMAGTTLLFPFIRETVANLTMRGRFGPIWIKPFNVQASIGAVPHQ